MALLLWSAWFCFFTVNSFLQRKSKALAPVKAAADEFVVEKVLEYVQGISEVRSYNLTGCASKELNEAIDKNRDINTTMELKTVPWMQLQSIILKLMGVAIIFDLMWILPCGQYDITELYWHDYLFFFGI